MEVKKDKSIDIAFKERIESIESIFSSYSDLHNMYLGALRTAKVNPLTLTAFERSAKSVAEAQKRISNRLYSQGFILLTGAAEALLKDVFESLLAENFTRLRSAKNINFTAPELQRIIREVSDDKPLDNMSTALGKLIKEKIFSTKNPTEKINFQNIQTMKEIFTQYFGLEFTNEDMLKAIHRYWQVRHCLVHNNAIIDGRFINNVNAVGLLKQNEVLGKRLTVNKIEFGKAKDNFLILFSELSNIIAAASLQSKFIESAEGNSSS